MANTTQKQTLVGATRKMKITYEWRSFLGLFGSWREAKAKYMDDDLHIDIYELDQYRKIFINGEEFRRNK